MDPLTIAAIGQAGIGALGTIFNQSKAAQSQAKYDNMIQKRLDELKNQYAKERNTDFLDTSVGSSFKNLYEKSLESEQARIKGEAVAGGATTEAQIAANTAAGDQYSEGVSKLASMGTQYRQNVDNLYQGQIANAFNAQTANQAQKTESWLNLSQNAGDILAGGLSQYAKTTAKG